ncbi:thiamine-phosphate kinase [Methanimicrococcus sp. OttesenSCG-928-J09]|nr:thiamine-phosphate kinase [Methanimicrococcus sp. OttesenSCG-928-J09]
MGKETVNSNPISDSSHSPHSSNAPAEKDFIREFSRVFQLKNKPLLSGSEFDDCAAVRLSAFCRDLSSESLTFSTDTVRESTDFPAGMTLWQKGWMAAAVNLSDLAAMGSTPVAFLFSAGLPRGFTLEDTTQLAQGIQECVSFFGAEVIGGDTEYSEELTITGTVIGISNNKHLTLRKNAQPGDLLCLTGFAGSAGVALKVLLDQTSKVVSEAFLKNLSEPFPRIFEGKMLAESGAVNSMIDTSDGLASSVYELSALSGVFFEIDEQNLPLDGEALNIISSYLKNEDKNEKNDADNQEQRDTKAYDALISEALYTGGDFELLFTISPDKLSLVEELFRQFNTSAADRFSRLPSDGKSGRFPCKFTVIGKAIAEKENVILRHTGNGQKRYPLLKMGYDSFTKYI